MFYYTSHVKQYISDILYVELISYCTCFAYICAIRYEFDVSANFTSFWEFIMTTVKKILNTIRLVLFTINVTLKTGSNHKVLFWKWISSFLMGALLKGQGIKVHLWKIMFSYWLIHWLKIKSGVCVHGKDGTILPSARVCLIVCF